MEYVFLNKNGKHFEAKASFAIELELIIDGVNYYAPSSV